MDFLDLLEPEAAEAFRARARGVSFEPAAVLLHEGEAGDRVLVLDSGRVKVACTTAEGKEMVLRFCGPGELLGELAVIDGRPRSSSVIALEPVQALALSATDFLALLDSAGGVALAILRLMTQRFRDADRKRIEFGASDTVGRVAARLVELAERYGERAGERTVITLPLSQEELAGWTASSREAVAKALHTLRELGWIETGRRQITVLDLASLAERAA